MSNRTRTAVLLLVLGVWTVVVAAYLIAGELPDAALVGIPAAVILALGRRRDDADDEPEPDRPRPNRQPVEGGEAS